MGILTIFKNLTGRGQDVGDLQKDTSEGRETSVVVIAWI